MPGIIKGLVRYSVIGGLCLAGVTLLVGPERVIAVFHQVRANVTETIDANIDDPILLRQQLRALEEKYPDRIEAVGRDLAAVDRDIAELQRDSNVAAKTVSLINDDMTKIDKLIEMAEARQNAGVQTVAIRYDNKKMPLTEAYVRSARLQAGHDFFTQRISDNQTHLGYLQQQRDRLEALLVQLETEHAQFESQLWQLDNQIASLARNERLIKQYKDREHRYDKTSNYEVASLEQLNSKLTEIRDQQEHQLAQLAERQRELSYWERAKRDLRAEELGEEIVEDMPFLFEDGVIDSTEVIELPQDDDATSLVLRD
jgi:chromosome segregation ATPase